MKTVLKPKRGPCNHWLSSSRVSSDELAMIKARQEELGLSLAELIVCAVSAYTPEKHIEHMISHRRLRCLTNNTIQNSETPK